MNLAAIGPGRTAAHLISYARDAERDACIPQRDLALTLRVPHPVIAAVLHAPGREPAPRPVTTDGEHIRLTIPRLDVYAVLDLRS